MRNINLTRRRSTALLSAAVLAVSAIVATMGVANGAVSRGGGLNDQNVPNFYRDAQGVALQLCVDANEELCEPADADHIGVYFGADASAGPLTAIYGVGAVQNTDTPGGDPLVMNEARFRIQNARANTTYTIKDPWSTSRCRTDGLGDGDCRKETSGNFDTVKNGHVTTFLRSVSRNGSAFIGSGALTSKVAGSPTGFNKVRITGGGRSWGTNQWTLMGEKRAATPMSAINKRSLQLGTGRSANVVTKSIRYLSFGTANARPTVRKGGTNAGAFSVRDTCASEAPGQACDVMVTFRPGQHANSTKRAFLTIDDNGLAAPRRVSLKGVGVRR